MATEVNLLEALREHLNDRRLGPAVELIDSFAGSDPDVSDVVTMLAAQLKRDVQQEKPTLFNCGEAMLNRLAEKLDPESVLLSLIENMEKCDDEVAFVTVLRALEVTLRRLSKKRLNPFAWGLNTVQCYLIERLQLPENFNLEEEEQMLYDADPQVEKVTSTYEEVIPFYENLIKDFLSESPAEESAVKVHEEKRLLLFKFHLQLLGKPLGYLDLKDDEKKAKSRRLAERIVGNLLQIHVDIFSLLNRQKTNDVYDFGEIDQLSVAVLYYLTLSQSVGLDRVPKIYNPVYIFQHSLKLGTELLTQDNQFLIHDGLELTDFLVKMVQNLVLPCSLLDLPDHSSFCYSITNIVIYSVNQKYRTRALQLFRTYLFLFEPQGRYHLIYNLMKILHHTGIIGYIIILYKDMLMEEFGKATFSSHFTGVKLYSILKTFCHLHRGEESDLVELADQIVASLNLLRFLAIRDKGNITKVWNYFHMLERHFLAPLKKGLVLSRAHYELKLKELQEESGKGDEAVEVEVMIAGQKLNDLPASDKLKVLNSALTSFDVMESLLSRVNELIELDTN